jgi:predicted esterase
MKKSCIAVLFLLTVVIVVSGQEKKEEKFATYQEMRAHIGKLYQDRKYEEAAEILKKALTQYPDHLYANAFNLALMYVQMGEDEKALEALEYGIENGVWFGKYALANEIWAPLEELTEFEAFKQKNEQKRLEAQKSARPKLEVFVPENFDKDKQYPLFIALHGGGENIEVFKPQWTSELMKKKFIVAYPQSSQLINMDGYNWTEDIELTKKEIKEAHAKVIQDYPVDRGRIIVGGFSSGGVASLVTILDQVIPVIGFVVLCPGKPEGFSAEKVREAKARGIRGTLLTTEMDTRLADQKDMAEIMQAAGLDHKFIVTPNIGHWYPENLAELIDAAIEHILGGTSHQEPPHFKE